MVEEKVEVKVQKIVKEPQLSLKRFSQYMVASERGKHRILKGSKYPGGYVPRFYEMARKLICEIFSANFDDFEVYFEEFKRQADFYRNEAKSYPKNRDGFKNRVCSANGLDEVCSISDQLIPILKNYIVGNNLSKRKDNINKNGVRIGAMADMLVYENGGASQVGFIKFNFTTALLSKTEAQTMLFVLNQNFYKKGLKLNPKSCFLIDVFARRIYTLNTDATLNADIDMITIDITKKWDLI